MTPLTFPTPPRRILIIKPSAIGDIVHALPILNLIRRRWHDSHITWVVTPACAGMVEGHPQIDEVIRFDRNRFRDFWFNPRSALAMRRFFRKVRKQSFDLVIDLQGLFRSGWFAWLSGAPIRVGFDNSRELSRCFYTHRVESSWADHAIERYLCVARALGCGDEPLEFKFALDDRDRAAAAALLPSRPFAVLVPGANWETKRWPAERFAALVEPLHERFGFGSVIVGSAGDGILAARIGGAIDLTGRTNLRQLVAVLERASLVIAGDTGPMHIASALGRPLVTLYGPTDAVLTGPFGRIDTVVQLDISCRPCFSRKCSHQSCLRWMEIEPVLTAAQEQLAKCQPSTLSAAGLDPI